MSFFCPSFSENIIKRESVGDIGSGENIVLISLDELGYLYRFMSLD
jgi:hypothetical protein